MGPVPAGHFDNLTTGQNWSFDVENPWKSQGGTGWLVARKLKARRGDELRIRYNVRTLGYIAVVGSGITIVDLNRGYRVTCRPVRRPAATERSAAADSEVRGPGARLGLGWTVSPPRAAAFRHPLVSPSCWPWPRSAGRLG